MSAEWRVTALRYAQRPTSRADIFYRYAEYGEPDAPTEMAYYVWLLQSATMTILVDTGFSARGGERRGRGHTVAPLELLARVGVTPETVDLLVVTHLHYDHTGHLDAFSDVPMVIPSREVDTWASPLARREQFAAHIEPDEVEVAAARVRAGRAELLVGEAEIATGIRAIEVGGHSPWQMILRI
jgi:glyoxylase-like metal-dependent hydrolase (beta-lactamase superfamily II)